MNFLNNLSDGKKMTDKVFKAAVACFEDIEKHGDIVVNATLGTLFDEEGTLVAFDSVWKPYEEINKIQKAKYASSIQGNPEFRTSVYNWLFGELDETIECEIIATPGGAGAISSTLKNVLNPGQSVLKPSQGWGPYKTMAAEFNLKLKDYNLFKDSAFDIEDFTSVLKETVEKEGKALVIINDPCHNPTGYTLSTEEWDNVIDVVNEASKIGPVVILNDIAYVDFNNKTNAWKQGFTRYNKLSDNAMAVIAFSISKTFTAYGARCGAQVVITKNNEEREKFKDAAIYSARSIWSTVNNSAMRLFTKIMDDDTLRNNYITEKQQYIELLKDRAEIFVSEANEVGLPIYPYKEGFFVTIEIKDDTVKTAFNKTLQENHIFTVEVDGGLRVAICSVPKRKLKGLAKRIKDLM